MKRRRWTPTIPPSPITPPLAPARAAGRQELGMPPRRAVRPIGRRVGGADLSQEDGVLLRPLRRRSLPPRVVPARGDLEHAAHRGNAVLGLVGAHEFVDPGGIFPVSRANQAAAFARIAPSSRSVRFSRRSRASSAFSSLVRAVL